MNLEDIILQQMLAEQDLIDTECALKHNDDEEHPAVDFLCHQMGLYTTMGTIEPDAEYRIPICQECMDGLLSGEWVLFYCMGCEASQWLLKSAARRDYGDTNIIALKKCPKCYNELLD